MYKTLINTKGLPSEYKQCAEEVFLVTASVEQIESFAKILGIGQPYKKLYLDAGPEAIHKRLECFQINLNLLIQKSWVEKTDEMRKDKLQDQIPDFIARIEREDYKQALVDFNGILNELAFLFFGAQSSKEDFTEYTLRIDTQMGLFWWYGTQLNAIEQTDPAYLRALLLLGVCYLSNF